MMKIALLTSGGDAPGMNAAIRAVVRRAGYYGLTVYGIERGFAGLLNGEGFRPLNHRSVADIIHRGGTILRTARAPEFCRASVQDQAAAWLREQGIEALIVIGGDGSFRGGAALQERGLRFIGIPATIDNDIYGTDLTIGFDTAVNTAADAINRLRDTATSHERVFVIEVMGRCAGFIALASGLAGGAESILVPEMEFNLEDICRRLLAAKENGRSHSIIVVAEGAASAMQMGEEIKKRTGLETRVTILGHLQRGGTPTAADRILATQMGAAAVDLLRRGENGVMVGYVKGRIEPVPLAEVFSGEKTFPAEAYELAHILSLY
ncbi:MAG TPA: 6-phosphofructokinase [Bacillota bacterium]|nr:6-phosphofructokinase [Bacillota bacterium]